MERAEDDSRDRRRRRTSSASPDAPKERRRRDREEDHSGTRRRDDGRSSREDRRRRDSYSPDSKSSYQRDDRRRERRDRSRDSADARRRRRSVSREDRHRRRHRHRHDDEEHRPSKRPRSRSRSRSPAPRRRRSRSPATRPGSTSPRALKRSKGPLPSQKDAFSNEVAKTDSPAPEKQRPNFANTGRLAAESNTVTVNGTSVVLKYHEPPEARKPPAKDAWRLYVFKGSDLLETVELGGRSCWLIGRERLVVDFPVDHPSCSKQHAAIQFRYVEKRNEFGDRIGRVRPYLIDLESANGSMVNEELIPPGRYVELRDKDVLKFGLSSREYVLMLPPPE
ncbi:hypothetical protein DTO212C5_2225 [Paecilomyces variotii]|nr:hypothetical protein DTO212C5_2225 [Paecilomyces variotii]